MPSTPYSKILVSVNGAGTTFGGLTVPGGATIQLSAESTIGWPASQAPKWEIYGFYIPTFSVPAGWTDDGLGTYYYLGTSPPSFTLPTAALGWGKFFLRLTVAGGIKNGKASSDMIDTATALSIVSNSGLVDVGYQEGTQFSTKRTWTAALQKNLRTVDAASVINVKSFGAKGDNVADDTAAIILAIAALWRLDPFFGPHAGRTLFFPAGFYRISAELFFRSSTGLHIMGEGPEATIIRWFGGGTGSGGTTTPGTFPMFRINASQFCTVENLSLWGNATNKPSEMIFADYAADPSDPSTFVGTQLKLTNVKCTGQSGFKEYEIGLRFSGAKNNNDLGTYLGCTWEFYAETAVSLEGTQQKQHSFFNCNAYGGWDGVTGHGGGKSGVDTSRGTGLNAGGGGSFIWISGACGANRVAGWVIGSPDDPILIQNVQCEGNWRLVDNDVAGGGPSAVGTREITVQGVRDDVGAITNYAPDRVRLSGPGPFVVNGNVFAGQTASLPYILFEGTPAGRYEARGNMFFTNGSFRAKGVKTNSGQPLDWDIGNNLYLDDVGNPIASMEWLDSNNENPYVPIAGINIVRPDYQGHAGKPGAIVRASAFTTAGLTQSIKVLDVPRGTRIKNIYLYNFQIPIGPGLSAAHVQIGSTSTGAEFLLSADVFSGPSSGKLYGAVTGDLGANFTGASFAQGAYVGDYNNTTSVYATLTTVGCNLNALTNGYFFLWLEMDVLQRFVF